MPGPYLGGGGGLKIPPDTVTELGDCRAKNRRVVRFGEIRLERTFASLRTQSSSVEGVITGSPRVRCRLFWKCQREVMVK